MMMTQVRETPSQAVAATAGPAEIPEIWSTRLSLLGAVLSVPAVAFLMLRSTASPLHLATFSVYGLGLLSMFLASAYFHSQAGRERRFSKCLDYGAIGLMIAGNFTPYCTLAIATPFAHNILALVWVMALSALTLRITKPLMSKWIFVSLFLAMGWLGLLLAKLIWNSLGPSGTWLTVAGGAIYTLGTLFFNRYDGDVELPGFGHHDIWHIFILLAAGTHYSVLWLYLLPR